MKGHRTLKIRADVRPVWFIADPHFYQESILKWKERDFKDVNHMNESMIEAWNEKIKSRNDLVFVLGDFCFGTKAQHLDLMDRLNGTKILVIGNHDSSIYGDWEKIDNLIDIKIYDDEYYNGQRVTLCHYPMLSWYGSHKGAWQLYGHVHGRLTNKDMADDGWTLDGKISPRQLEVGADVTGLSPISWDEVKEKINEKIWQ
jgi:calcineurin-like phosphoesterase family protein